MTLNKFGIHEPTLKMIIEEVSRFDASVIIEGKADTEQDRIVDAYAEGTVQGYKDAVKQILEFLRDLQYS